jgi:hypothetical protein
MKQSYLGIITPRGLEVFCPEHPDTLRFLWRRARRLSAEAECIWTVIPDDVAKLIRQNIERFRTKTALDILSRTSLECGYILPTNPIPEGLPIISSRG